MRGKVTQRQRQVLDCISRHIDMHGYPPTVREIGEAIGLSSSSTVHAHLRNLEEKGLIVREAVLTRAIKVVSGGVPGGKPKKLYSLPLVGRVAAGKPTLAVEDIEDYYPIPQDFLSGEDGFLLEVKGDSMIDDGIREGDYVIVRRQPTADNGDTVVALFEGEATVKKFYREHGRFRLQPANAQMQPIFLKEVEVVGRVVGLIRRML